MALHSTETRRYGRLHRPRLLLRPPEHTLKVGFLQGDSQRYGYGATICPRLGSGSLPPAFGGLLY